MHADLAAQLSPGALKQLGGSDLEYDTDKLEQLSDVVPEEQEAVVRAHVGLRVPWSEALVGKTLRSSAAPAANAPQEASAFEGPPRRRIERRRVSDLKPNRFNAGLFPDSLDESNIAQIADDLARNGQRVPVEITPDDEITDGERRWRGAQQLGWDEIDVVVGPAFSDDEMLDRVLDACTSSRQMSLREQANVYTAVCVRLKREVGREAGRSNQTIPKGIICVTPRSIKEAAAKRAGFSSTTLALRAEAVFTRGTEDIQTKVREGSVTITAAYDQLPKRAKAKGAAEKSAAREQPGEGDDESRDDAEPTTPTAEPGSPSVPAAAQPANAAPRDDDTPDGDADTAEPGSSQVNDTPKPADDEPDENENEDEDEDEEAADDPEPDPTSAVDDDATNISLHVSAVCHHLSRLAELNYEDAVCWFDQTVEEMKGSLGEPPEFDDQDFDN